MNLSGRIHWRLYDLLRQVLLLRHNNMRFDHVLYGPDTLRGMCIESLKNRLITSQVLGDVSFWSFALVVRALPLGLGLFK